MRCVVISSVWIHGLIWYTFYFDPLNVYRLFTFKGRIMWTGILSRAVQLFGASPKKVLFKAAFTFLLRQKKILLRQILSFYLKLLKQKRHVCHHVILAIHEEETNNLCIIPFPQMIIRRKHIILSKFEWEPKMVKIISSPLEKKTLT